MSSDHYMILSGSKHVVCRRYLFAVHIPIRNFWSQTNNYNVGERWPQMAYRCYCRARGEITAAALPQRRCRDVTRVSTCHCNNIVMLNEIFATIPP